MLVNAQCHVKSGKLSCCSQTPNSYTQKAAHSMATFVHVGGDGINKTVPEKLWWLLATLIM